MGLNPSCNNVQGQALPVLGDPPFSAEAAEIAKAELVQAFPNISLEVTSEQREVLKKGTKAHAMASAGIYVPSAIGPDDTEVVSVYKVQGSAYGWKFWRAWYYWVCTTDDRLIPEDAARSFNETWGKQVRVEGFAGGRDVRGPVDGYHVDTLDGLKALAELIRTQV